MDELRALAAGQGGYFTRRDARALGYDDRAVVRCLRAGAWIRFRHGAYAFTDVWNALDDVGRHVVRARAVRRSLGDAVALSHVTGLLVQDATVPTWGLDLSRVHVTRLDGGAGRVEGDVVHHEGVVVDDDVVPTALGASLRPERCVLESGAAVGGGEVGLVVCNGVLHARLCTDEVLMQQFAVMEHWPKMRRMHVPVRMADGRYESAGESRGQWFCWSHHLPAPVPQFEVRDAHGRLIATCDWGWPGHGAVGEFDGRVKYGRLVKRGQAPGDVVFAEKQREDAVREVVERGMLRVIWADYDRPRVLDARFRRTLGLAA